MDTTIIVIGGLPGAGKSTLAKALSRKTMISVFAKDELEAAVARKRIFKNDELNGVGYEIMKTLAACQDDVGNRSIFDFIASKTRVSEFWPALLKRKFKYIECVCSSEATHQKRIEKRVRCIEGWYELTWDDVKNIKESYVPLRDDRLILDSMNDLNSNLKAAMEYVSQ